MSGSLQIHWWNVLEAWIYLCAEGKEYPEIPVSEFPAHVEAMHVDSDFAFSQEFDVSQI